MIEKGDLFGTKSTDPPNPCPLSALKNHPPPKTLGRERESERGRVTVGVTKAIVVSVAGSRANLLVEYQWRGGRRVNVSEARREAPSNSKLIFHHFASPPLVLAPP